MTDADIYFTCEREDHSLKSMNFGASGKDCPYCRIEELEARLDAVKQWQQENRKLIEYVAESYPIPEALGDGDE